VENTKTILVADDSPSVRTAVCEWLEAKLQCTAVEATNGFEAIKKAGQMQQLDLILLDLVMPELNGFEAAAVLKRKMPDVPIILFTMHEEAVRLSLANAIGVDAVLYKADGIQKLTDTVKALLDGDHNKTKALAD
jgi:CheY-like chemotaxis protein